MCSDFINKKIKNNSFNIFPNGQYNDSTYLFYSALENHHMGNIWVLMVCDTILHYCNFRRRATIHTCEEICFHFFFFLSYRAGLTTQSTAI